MTRRPFVPTHQITLTDRYKRSPRRVVPVLLGDDGAARTEDEHRSGAARPDWTYDSVHGWRWRSMGGVLPDGYTTVKVKRLTESGEWAAGPTVVKGGTGATRKITIKLTDAQDDQLRSEAKRDGKGPSVWAQDVIAAELDRRKRR